MKHFKHIPVDESSPVGGKRRLHKKPSAREVRCCRPWFDAEWSLLTEAKILVCLGATASTAVLGPGFRVSKERGKIIESDYCDRTIATWHPSAILRTVDVAAKQQKMEQLIRDLKVAIDVSEK